MCFISLNFAIETRVAIQNGGKFEQQNQSAQVVCLVSQDIMCVKD